MAIYPLSVKPVFPRPGAQRHVRRVNTLYMQASIDDLTRRGRRIVMNTGGGRLCIEASIDQGESRIDGVERGTRMPLVIPKGY